VAGVSGAEEEWLWGWDETPGIVSVWAEPHGRAYVWRREAGALLREEARFRPWMLVPSLRDLEHLGRRLVPAAGAVAPGVLRYRELSGVGELRFLVDAEDLRGLSEALLRGANQRLASGVRALRHVRELGTSQLLLLPPEEQYLVATGRNYFRGLGFDQLRRLQFDLETTGLDPARDRVFLIALRTPEAALELLEAGAEDDAAEAELLRRFMARVEALDPDVIENHNLHGFDLPFLAARARRLQVSLNLGRIPQLGLRQRPAARGVSLESEAETRAGPLRRFRYCVAGRELIDSMDSVRRYDFAVRDLPGHGLKAVARHFGLASPEREYVPGAQVAQLYREDPERVRRYAADDVHEAEGVARLLGGTAFALARMVPRRYERVADAGPATGVLDPLLVRAYLRAGAALPSHQSGDGTVHSGAALHLFASGVAERIVKADVASLYPSLMREYRIGPRRDTLGALLSLVERLTDLRLQAKGRAREATPGSAARHSEEAMSAAMKLVINSAYGYMGAVQLTRFADVHAANEVTRRGRELLSQICRELAQRGVTLLEADTDGVYFSVPPSFSQDDERRVVHEVAALLPRHVRLELEGRYAAMLSHEPKNYALLGYGGELLLRGVAFRSSRAEPFGEAFLRAALARLLRGDVQGARDAYVSTYQALRRRTLPTFAVSSRVRLSKTPAQYLATRGQRRELSYEAMLQNGVSQWRLGERVRVYRAVGKRAGLLAEEGDTPNDAADSAQQRDYDSEYYTRLLRDTFAARLARGLSERDFAALCADPGQLNLFDHPLEEARPILTHLPQSG
jgi:DNA polymerase elongation subunit (family B)